MPKRTPSTPAAVQEALSKLARDIGLARRRQRLPMEILAMRARTTRQTVGRVVKGDPRVAMGTWAAVLSELGMLPRLAEVAAPAFDMPSLRAQLGSVAVRIHDRQARRHRPPRKRD